MYRHILIAVALPPWDAFSLHPVAAREAAAMAQPGEQRPLVRARWGIPPGRQPRVTSHMA
jgi:hypothetical protein